MISHMLHKMKTGLGELVQVLEPLEIHIEVDNEGWHTTMRIHCRLVLSVAPYSRSDPIGGSELSPGSSKVYLPKHIQKQNNRLGRHSISYKHFQICAEEISIW